MSPARGPESVRSATQRLFWLTGLRWLPVGLLTPVLVLLAQERGLSLTQVGLVFVVHGAVIVALELPTGGIADVLGRRPVLVASAVLHLCSCVALVLATDLTGFVVAAVLKAVGRTLDSGPLEAWYVDTVHGLDPDADLTPGLSWRGAADGLGLGVGAVVGGLLPALVAGGGAQALVVPVAVAAALDLVYLAALLPLLAEQRPPREGSALAALGQGAAQVPAVVVGAGRLAVVDGPLRLVLVLSLLVGVALAGLELLGPVRFAELAGSADAGAAVFGVVLATSFAAAALGSLAASRVRALTHGSTPLACALVTLAGAIGVGALAGLEAALLAGVAFTVFYAGNGALWPLLHAVSHDRVTAVHRATVLSAMSLAVAVGGIAGSLALPALADVTSTTTAFGATAAVALLTAALCLLLPADTSACGRRPRRRHRGRTLPAWAPRTTSRAD